MKKYIIAFLLLILTVVSANAQTYYVRDGGSGDGSSWSNAFDNLPSTLVRGATYYVADGSYGNYTFNTAASGSSTITIKKATVSAHGTETGWSNSYGDGVATFGVLRVVTNYLVFDGATRNTSDWFATGSYGFRLTNIYAHSNEDSYAGDYVTIQYCEIGGSTITSTWYSGMPQEAGISCKGWEDHAHHWTIQYNYIRNIDTVAIQQNDAYNFTIQYNAFQNIWGKEIIRGQNTATNTIIRYNVGINSCIGGYGSPPGWHDQCTALVGFFTNGSETPEFEGLEIYGNVFSNTINDDQATFTSGSLMAESAAKIYNNTIINYAPPSTTGNGAIRLFWYSGSDARNNILYYPNGISYYCEAATCNNNSVFTSSAPPLVNIAGKNFGLTSSLAGVSLSSAYNTDMTGVTRGSDGTWDRGALEYGGTPTPDETPPVLYNTYPSGTIVCTSDPMTVSESLNSDEAATVRYSTTDQSYDDMAIYPSTGGTTHQRTVSRACNASYTVYSRGVDASGNKNTSSAITSYTIGAYNPGATSVTLTSAYSVDVNSSGTKFLDDGDDWVGRGNSGALRVVNMFSLNEINADWTITGVEYRVYVESKEGSPGTITASRYGISHSEDSPHEDAGSDVYTKAAGVTYTTLSEPSTGWTSWMDLGSTAIADIEWCGDESETTFTVALRASAEIEGGETVTYLALSDDNDVTRAELKITYTYVVPEEEGDGPESTFISGTRFGENSSATVKNVTLDKYITVYDPTLSFSTHYEGFVGTYPAETAGQVLQLKFNLSSISDTANINSAKLYLYQHEGSGDDAINISIHSVNGTAWDADSTWTNYDWTTKIAAAETTRNLNSVDGWRSWTVTSMVADWVATPANNKGMILATDQGATHAASGTYRGYIFSEYSDLSLRPILIIDYTIPDPQNIDTSFGAGTLTITPSGGSLTFTW